MSNTYDAQIIADSIGPNWARITTFQLKYPRMIHSEFMTHRAISRNASSTRAIPTSKMIEWIEKDPAMPVYWGKNQKGMQATEELSEIQVEAAKLSWLWARDRAVEQAKTMMGLGVHKQIASRILEPWAHINVVATATNWDNFFSLRCDKNAMPEIQALAVKMARAYRDSEPRRLKVGRLHLPYVTEQELSEPEFYLGSDLLDNELWECEQKLLAYSVARCARVSYMTFDGKAPVPAKDIELHDSLEVNGHWSPFEHQARAQPVETFSYRSGNFRGWTQYRQTLRRSVHERFDFSKLDEFGDRDFTV